jgi:hypothetical protein
MDYKKNVRKRRGMDYKKNVRKRCGMAARAAARGGDPHRIPTVPVNWILVFCGRMCYYMSVIINTVLQLKRDIFTADLPPCFVAKPRRTFGFACVLRTYPRYAPIPVCVIRKRLEGATRELPRFSGLEFTEKFFANGRKVPCENSPALAGWNLPLRLAGRQIIAQILSTF